MIKIVGLLLLVAQMLVATHAAIPPGTYTALMPPLRYSLTITSDNVYTMAADSISSRSPTPQCVVAGVLSKVGSTIKTIDLAGGEGCPALYASLFKSAAEFSTGKTTIDSNGVISTAYTNKTGTFTAVLNRSESIAQGLYCTSSTAKVPGFLRVAQGEGQIKYTYQWSSSADGKFMCSASGALIGGPNNAITVDGVQASNGWGSPVAAGNGCASLTQISYSASKKEVTVKHGTTSVVLATCNGAAWTKPQTYCGNFGSSWTVNAHIESDSTIHLQLMPRASPLQPSPDYCHVHLGYAAMPGGALRLFVLGAAGNCAKAQVVLNTVRWARWVGNTLDFTARGPTQTTNVSYVLSATNCFNPPLGSYGGTGSNVNAAVNVLPNRNFQFMMGWASESDFSCVAFGQFVNSTAASLFVTSDSARSNCAVWFTSMSFASNNFSIAGKVQLAPTNPTAKPVNTTFTIVMSR
jgi:hypothetical protein